MEEKKHSKYAPSAAHRWMSCPGSVSLSEKCEKSTSHYAKEGTAAHKLAEMCVVSGKDVFSFIDSDIEGIEVTEEMAEAVSVYVETVSEDRDIDDYIGVEEPFDLSWLHPGMFGSNDFYRYKQDIKKLFIYDYKHGKGVVVEPEWNPQLMLYAVGAIKSICDKSKTPVFQSCVETVELVVVQPRALLSSEPVKRWEIKSVDLLFWALNVARPAAIAVDTKNTLAEGEHCKFCPALAVCPQVAKRTQELAQIAFDDDVKVLPTPEELTPVAISKILSSAELISEWIKAVEKYALNQLEIGMQIPGYKLVQKHGRRKWLNEAQAEMFLSSLLPVGELYTKKLKSIAQVEKIKTIKAIGKEALSHLYFKPELGNDIVPDSDKREEVGSGLELFDEVIL